MARRQDFFNEQLKCSVWQIVYDFRRKYGVVNMPPMACTDMVGAITLFLTIDPDVEMIETRAGADLDTTYKRTPQGWVARTPRGEVGEPVQV